MQHTQIYILGKWFIIATSLLHACIMMMMMIKNEQYRKWHAHTYHTPIDGTDDVDRWFDQLLMEDIHILYVYCIHKEIIGKMHIAIRRRTTFPFIYSFSIYHNHDNDIYREFSIIIIIIKMIIIPLFSIFIISILHTCTYMNQLNQLWSRSHVPKWID